MVVLLMGGVINLAYAKISPGTYGFRYDMYNCTSTSGQNANNMRLYLIQTDKTLEDFTEPEMYDPYKMSWYMLPKLVSCGVRRISSKTISDVYSGLEYTFTIQNSSTTDSITFNGFYVCSANNNSSTPSYSNLYTLSIHKLEEPITLALQETCQIKVTYDNLVAETPSSVASD
jgi:hypothetical protein